MSGGVAGSAEVASVVKTTQAFVDDVTDIASKVIDAISQTNEVKERAERHDQ